MNCLLVCFLASRLVSHDNAQLINYGQYRVNIGSAEMGGCNALHVAEHHWLALLLHSKRCPKTCMFKDMHRVRFPGDSTLAICVDGHLFLCIYTAVDCKPVWVFTAFPPVTWYMSYKNMANF